MNFTFPAYHGVLQVKNWWPAWGEMKLSIVVQREQEIKCNGKAVVCPSHYSGQQISMEENALELDLNSRTTDAFCLCNLLVVWPCTQLLHLEPQSLQLQKWQYLRPSWSQRLVVRIKWSNGWRSFCLLKVSWKYLAESILSSKPFSFQLLQWATFASI